MNQTEANRLATMYHFIKELPVHKLDMDDVVSDGEANSEKELVAQMFDEKCGTAGCMAGLSPALFPRLFKYVGSKNYGWDVQFRNQRGYRHYQEILARAFGITQFEAEQLGSPTCTTPEKSKQIALTRMKRIAEVYGYVLE